MFDKFALHGEFQSYLSTYLSIYLPIYLSIYRSIRSVQNQILGWKHATGRTIYGIRFGTTDFSSSIYVSIYLSS